MVQTFSDEDNQYLIDKAKKLARLIENGAPSSLLVAQTINYLMLQDLSVQIRNLNSSNEGMLKEVLELLNARLK